MEDELPPQGSGSFLNTLIFVGVLSIGFAVMMSMSMAPNASPQVGREFPPIEAASWINGAPPELRGHVLVIDAWAFWCGPCRMATPMLLHLHEKYKDQDVIFIGLTSEGSDQAAAFQSKKYVESESIPWSNGIAAVKTLSALKVDGIPQFWVVDRENRIVAHVEGYDASAAEVLERGVIQALAASGAGNK